MGNSLLAVRGINHKYIVVEETTKIPVRLSAWMELTKTPCTEKEQITRLMMKEIDGGDKTGFAPYFRNREIYFDQRWLLVMGRKDKKGEQP